MRPKTQGGPPEGYDDFVKWGMDLVVFVEKLESRVERAEKDFLESKQDIKMAEELLNKVSGKLDVLENEVKNKVSMLNVYASMVPGVIALIMAVVIFLMK
jgi:flagellar motility protein MotE (MotC chaperone)